MSRRVALCALLALACPGDGGQQPPPPPPPMLGGLALSDVGAFDRPVFLAAPANDDRLFVVEQGGRIRVVKQGTTLPTPFLDLSGRISSSGERGLLGLAFHPEYASNGLFVVNYTDPGGTTQVASFRVSSADPDRSDPNSEQSILTVAQPFANHNGGMVAFGPDNHLYIGMGDGGSAGDPQGNGQKLTTLLGKLVRVALSGTGQVSIPPDNPFVSQSGARPEIWSTGLRNPWRFSFDRVTGDLYLGDVGQNEREEIDVAAGPAAGRGLNFGWNTMEGTACYSGGGCSREGLTLPVLEYLHSSGCSVTGGYVYRGTAIPSLAGTYFYADYCQGWVRSFRLAAGATAEGTEWQGLAPGGQIASFGEDAHGELYLMTIGGRLAKIVAAP